VQVIFMPFVQRSIFMVQRGIMSHWLLAGIASGDMPASHRGHAHAGSFHHHAGHSSTPWCEWCSYCYEQSRIITDSYQKIQVQFQNNRICQGFRPSDSSALLADFPIFASYNLLERRASALR